MNNFESDSEIVKIRNMIDDFKTFPAVFYANGSLAPEDHGTGYMKSYKIQKYKPFLTI
jgi:hypothetical protein